MYIKNIVYCFFFLFIYSCIPYKSYQKTDSICEVGMIFQEYEKFFDKKLTPLVGEWQKIDSINFLLTYVYYNKEGFTISKYYQESNIIKRLKYDTLGRIKSVVFTYDRVNIEDSYLFDTLGNITKTIDERQAGKYPICFREALEIVKRKTPKRYVINAIERDSMMVDNQKVYHWLISTGDPKKYYWYYYYINAKTGKLIKKVRVQQGYDD